MDYQYSNPGYMPAPPQDYKVWSIVNIILNVLCCGCCGIIGLVFAVMEVPISVIRYNGICLNHFQELFKGIYVSNFFGLDLLYVFHVLSSLSFSPMTATAYSKPRRKSSLISVSHKSYCSVSASTISVDRLGTLGLMRRKP